MYIVLGATGHVGSATATALVRSGTTVTLVTRDEGKTDEWRARGAQAVVHIKGVAPNFLRADRLCVRCHGSSDPARLVHICAPAGEWKIPTQYVSCPCA